MLVTKSGVIPRVLAYYHHRVELSEGAYSNTLVRAREGHDFYEHVLRNAWMSLRTIQRKAKCRIRNKVLDMVLASRIFLAAFMTFAGVMHFVAPKGFVRVVPRWLPAPWALVYISGVAEILGGVGLLIPGTEHWAAWGLIALYVAVFPANVNMAIHHIGLGRKPTPAWLLWARLPMQGVLIAWAVLYTR